MSAQVARDSHRLAAGAAALSLAALLLCTGPAASWSQEAAGETPAAEPQGQLLDQIVASVDDEIILLSDLLSDLQLYARQAGSLPRPEEQRQILNESLENRIREKVLIAKARRDEVQVGEEELEQAMDQHVDRLVQQAGGEARFERELEREGLTLRELRKKLSEPMRDQLLVQRILERISYEVQVGDEELLAFFEENKGRPEVIPPRPRAVLLAHILLLPQADPAELAASQAKLGRARERLAAGEDFGDVAREISEGPAAARGGDVGWFSLEDLAVPELQQALSMMSPGDLRDDVVSEGGLHILKLEERSGGQVRFRQIFVALAMDEEGRRRGGAPPPAGAGPRGRDRAREAWSRLVDGEDWDAIVAEYSDDGGTKASGGLLPLIPEEQLEERYRGIVEVLDPGEFSGVFPGGRGFQIVRLVEREEPRPYRFEEISEDLRVELVMRKRSEALDAYVETLEGEVIVQRRELPALDEIAGLGEGP